MTSSVLTSKVPGRRFSCTCFCLHCPVYCCVHRSELNLDDVCGANEPRVKEPRDAVYLSLPLLWLMWAPSVVPRMITRSTPHASIPCYLIVSDFISSHSRFASRCFSDVELLQVLQTHHARCDHSRLTFVLALNLSDATFCRAELVRALRGSPRAADFRGQCESRSVAQHNLQLPDDECYIKRS